MRIAAGALGCCWSSSERCLEGVLATSRAEESRLRETLLQAKACGCGHCMLWGSCMFMALARTPRVWPCPAPYWSPPQHPPQLRPFRIVAFPCFRGKTKGLHDERQAPPSQVFDLVDPLQQANHLMHATPYPHGSSTQTSTPSRSALSLVSLLTAASRFFTS